jgi:hypothetical protein
MMRRAPILNRAVPVLSVLGLLAGLPALAAATPTITARATIVPIPKNPRTNGGPTWPGTGDILGAPAAVEIEGKISGTEYGGSPSPVKTIKVFLPKGVKVNEAGFARCSEAVLHEKGAEGCPLESVASSLGEANGVVSFGGERVHEKVSVQAFFNSAGGLIFLIVGDTPASLEEFATLTFANGPSGLIATAEIPLIETLPGADAASAEQFKIKIGAAFKRGNKLVSFGTLPKTCKGHLTGKAEVTFYSGETVPIEVSLPCPKQKK